MKFIIFISFSVVLFSSCAVVNHLDEALTLQEYSGERDAQAAFVEKRDREFDALLVRITAADPLTDLGDFQSLLDRLGPPVVRVPFKEDGVRKERWLYRYQTRSFKVPKVYFVINDKGRVERWSRLSPPRPATPSKNARDKQP